MPSQLFGTAPFRKSRRKEPVLVDELRPPLQKPDGSQQIEHRAGDQVDAIIQMQAKKSNQNDHRHQKGQEGHQRRYKAPADRAQGIHLPEAQHHDAGQKVYHQGGAFPLRLSMVELNTCCTFMEEHYQEMLPDTVEKVYLSERPKLESAIIYKKGRHLSMAERDFINLARLYWESNIGAMKEVEEGE